MAVSQKVVYGINTGFGPLCDTQITPEETSKLQENLLFTHADPVILRIISRPDQSMLNITFIYNI